MSDLIKRYITFFILLILISLVFIHELVSSILQVEILSSYIVQLIMFVEINMVMTASLGMINGFTGQFSIGHGGFMAVGAYTSVFFTTVIFKILGSQPVSQNPLGYSVFFFSLIMGGLFAGFTGFLIGIPTLRLKGDYLAIVTMAFGEVIRTIIRVSDTLGGPRGISGVPAMTKMTIASVFAIVSIWLMRNFLGSTYGRASRAVRDSEIAAEITGINTTRQKILVFSIASAFAGCCGGLYAHILQFVHPDNFTFMKSLEYLIYLYIGGASSLSGAILGASIFTIIPEVLRGFHLWRMVFFSLSLIGVMLFRPDGIAGDREFPFLRQEKRGISLIRKGV